MKTNPAIGLVLLAVVVAGIACATPPVGDVPVQSATATLPNVTPSPDAKHTTV